MRSKEYELKYIHKIAQIYCCLSEEHIFLLTTILKRVCMTYIPKLVSLGKKL